MLPQLRGRYKWQKTDHGYRILRDDRSKNKGRKHIAHFTRAVLLHVLQNQELRPAWKSKASLLRKLLRQLKKQESQDDDKT